MWFKVTFFISPFKSSWLSNKTQLFALPIKPSDLHIIRGFPLRSVKKQKRITQYLEVPNQFTEETNSNEMFFPVQMNFPFKVEGSFLQKYMYFITPFTTRLDWGYTQCNMTNNQQIKIQSKKKYIYIFCFLLSMVVVFRVTRESLRLLWQKEFQIKMNLEFSYLCSISVQEGMVCANLGFIFFFW